MNGVFEVVSDDTSLEVEGKQFLTFSIAGEPYAIELLKIREIIEYEEVTKIPLMPAYLSGVLNLRGKVVPVISLHQLFNLQSSKLTRKTCIIILDLPSMQDDAFESKMELGIIVDLVYRVINLPDELIEPAPEIGTSIRSDFIAGMGNIDGSFIVLLDVNYILSAEALTIIDHLSNGTLE